MIYRKMLATELKPTLGKIKTVLTISDQEFDSVHYIALLRQLLASRRFNRFSKI